MVARLLCIVLLWTIMGVSTAFDGAGRGCEQPRFTLDGGVAAEGSVPRCHLQLTTLQVEGC